MSPHLSAASIIAAAAAAAVLPRIWRSRAKFRLYRAAAAAAAAKGPLPYIKFINPFSVSRRKLLSVSGWGRDGFTKKKVKIKKTKKTKKISIWSEISFRPLFHSFLILSGCSCLNYSLTRYFICCALQPIWLIARWVSSSIGIGSITISSCASRSARRCVIWFFLFLFEIRFSCLEFISSASLTF